MTKLLLWSVLTVGLTLSVFAQENCYINIDNAPENFDPPLIVNPVLRKVLYPELEKGIRLLTIPSGSRVVAACTGKRNKFTNFDGKTVDVRCDNGQMTLSELYDFQTVTWEGLACERRPRAYIRIIRNRVCGEDGTRHDIGWTIRPNFFIPLLHVCVDTDREATEFTYHKVHGRIIGVKTVDSSRPGFRSAGMFSVDVNQDYKKKSQIALFRELLSTTEHMTGQGQHYLSRGHMAPDSDFFYAAEQDATYFYGNVVPQWQAFNNGNWKRLEFAIRELAEKHQATFDVWTGSYGTLQLPDINNNPVDLFLGLTDGKNKIPVPAVMWKVIQDPTIRHAVAIVAFNDVRGYGTSKDISLQEPPCNDLCDQLSWVDWDTQDISRGRIFCCNVRDLKTAIPAVPDLGSVILLDN